MIRKSMTFWKNSNQRHQNIVYQGSDNLAKCTTHDNADGHIYDIAFHDEFPEFLHCRFQNTLSLLSRSNVCNLIIYFAEENPFQKDLIVFLRAYCNTDRQNRTLLRILVYIH